MLVTLFALAVWPRQLAALQDVTMALPLTTKERAAIAALPETPAAPQAMATTPHDPIRGRISPAVPALTRAKVASDRPSPPVQDLRAAEAQILRLVREQAKSAMKAAPAVLEKISQDEVFAARRAVLELHMAPTLENYLIELVLASRDASPYDPSLARKIAWGASPRGSIALERCARARAWLAGRDFVTPEDLHAVAPDVLRHRVLPSYEATAEGWDGGKLVAQLLERVPLP